MKYCIIDVGTNSIRMMMALCKEGTSHIQVCEKQREVVRIGEELALTGKLSERGMNAALEAAKRYCAYARAQGAQKLCAFGTSAVRDAQNRQAFVSAFEQSCGVALDVLSGEEEARVGFCGALGMNGTGTVIEVGGGSTQVICGSKGEISLSASAPVGCVRALSLYGENPDCFHLTQKHLLTMDVECLHKGKVTTKRFDKILQLAKKTGGSVIALGGTATTLCSLASGMTQGYDARIVQGRALTQGEITRQCTDIARDTLDQRKKIPILADRADTILPGAALLLACMQQLEAYSVRTSDADNLEGYLVSKGL